MRRQLPLVTGRKTKRKPCHLVFDARCSTAISAVAPAEGCSVSVDNTGRTNERKERQTEIFMQRRWGRRSAAACMVPTH